MPDPVNKAGKVMGEFKRGELRSSTGAPVRDKQQAVAIAIAERKQDKAGVRRYAHGGPVKDLSPRARGRFSSQCKGHS